MQTCRRCRRPVVVGAPRCRHCGTSDPAPPKRRADPLRRVLVASLLLVLAVGWLFVDRYRDGVARQEACQTETAQGGVQPGSLAYDSAVAECIDAG
jgi:hypothetical protein